MPHPGTRSVVRVVTAAATAVLLTACTGASAEGVDLGGLDSGPCRDVVGTLEDVAADLRAVGEQEITPREAADRFAAAQDVLKPAATQAQVGESITELVTRLGFFRISVDSNEYDGGEDAKVRAALQALAEDCRAT